MEILLPLARVRDIVSLGAGEPANLLVGAEDGGSGDGGGRVAHKWSDHIIVMFGINMRCHGVHARRLLGYAPKGESVAASLPATLDLFLQRAKST